MEQNTILLNKTMSGKPFCTEQEEREESLTKPILYPVDKLGNLCPFDQERLESIAANIRLYNYSALLLPTGKCRKCGRQYIQISDRNAKLVSNYTISSNDVPVQNGEKSKTIRDQKTAMKLEEPSGLSATDHNTQEKTEPAKPLQTGQTKQMVIEKEAIPNQPAMPQSAVMTVKFTGLFLGRESITIVNNTAEENWKRGIYYYGRSVMLPILRSVFFNSPMEPRIKDTLKYPGFESLRKSMLHFCDTGHPKTIYITQNTISHGSEYEVVTAFVLVAGREEPITLSVYYNPKNGQYLLHEDTYRSFTARYGIPFADVQSIDGEKQGEWNLRQNSILKLYGYSVSQSSGIPRNQRRKVLEQLIDTGIMTKSSIMSHIEWLISIRKNMPAMRIACREWEDDLEYISRYEMKNQRVIWGSIVRKRVK